ncbi:phytoene/squalene synthase family protein [Pseudaminobacter soli (ex Li et al. 2025)]|uniref:Phytoene/squalene synthase family protein n=1 Tax=Pseudaminobacter soli (ex Li et al. 2025) TaxID=1295366 RepID=A0A2P7S832_9HYPH|nr:phytoene/squalene synthase family protein [Mesorhizobium soli]PSJ58620.1 phytoene/squalene synthase family protein [Mesorhizobium soli]
MEEHTKIVMEAVRTADRDRYLSALYAPEDKRPALFALYAFNAEIAGVRDRIREALPGEVRLQWWRDVLAAGNMQAAAGHPVAEALIGAIDTYGLPVEALQNYLDARIFDLYDDPMPSRNDLEGYCGETAGAIIQLAAMILEPEAAPSFANLAGHAGCAQAMTGLLRLLPHHRARGQCFVPRDILSAVGSSPEEFVSGDGGAGMSGALAAMIALAAEHLAAFERGARELPASLRPAFLPVALTGAYLARLRKMGREAATVPAEIAAWRRHAILFRHAARGWKSNHI